MQGNNAKENANKKVSDRDMSMVKCYQCGEMRHFAYDCPEKKRNGGPGGGKKTEIALIAMEGNNAPLKEEGKEEIVMMCKECIAPHHVGQQECFVLLEEDKKCEQTKATVTYVNDSFFDHLSDEETSDSNGPMAKKLLRWDIIREDDDDSVKIVDGMPEPEDDNDDSNEDDDDMPVSIESGHEEPMNGRLNGRRLEVERRVLFELLKSCEMEMVLHVDQEATKPQDDLYLLDSGANVHCTNDKTGMCDTRAHETPVTIGDSTSVKVELTGDLPLTTSCGQRILLTETRYIPGFHRNIISVVRLLDKGCRVENASRNVIVVTCGDGRTISFKRHPKDNLYYLRATRDMDQVTGRIWHYSFPTKDEDQTNPNEQPRTEESKEKDNESVNEMALDEEQTDKMALDDNEETIILEPQPTNTKVNRELSRLNTFYNPTMTTTIEDEPMDAVYNVSINSDPGDPISTRVAMRSPQWPKWREAPFTECDNPMKRKAWVVPALRPKGRKVIGTKSVHKTKHIDIRTRLMANMFENGDLDLQHVRSEDNPADIDSKNCKEAIHVKHASDIYNGELHTSLGEDVAMSAQEVSSTVVRDTEHKRKVVTHRRKKPRIREMMKSV